MLYHHSDGDPSGIGKDIKRFIAEKYAGFDIWEADRIATDIVRGRIRTLRSIWTFSGDRKEEAVPDINYDVTSCVHGDEEYIYVIDCEERTLKCYDRHLSDASVEETCVPERECEIPDDRNDK